jgi:carotenoid 1,2-hydratase
MTERGAGSVGRGADWLSLGPSNLVWDRSGLTVLIDEVAAPMPRRIRGRIRLFPDAVEQCEWTLDPAGRHRWAPIAPCARAEIEFERPALSWSGAAYLDMNAGDRPIETDFVRWTWSRAAVPEGTAILYDVIRRTPAKRDARLSLALVGRASGGFEAFAVPPLATLPSTRWGIVRDTGMDPGTSPAVVSTLEDTPFYARSIIAGRLRGCEVTAMHESLSFDRFRAPWVLAMLPFRMPRAVRFFSGG